MFNQLRRSLAAKIRYGLLLCVALALLPTLVTLLLLGAWAATHPDAAVWTLAYPLLLTTSGGIVVAVVAALLIGRLLAREVLRPLHELTVAARTSTGDLRSPVALARSDELGLLAQSFNDMLLRLRYLFGALGESEGRFRAIFDHSFQLMGLISRNGTMLEANRTTLEFAGLAVPAVVGQPFWKLLWAATPELEARMHEAFMQAAKGQLTRIEIDGQGRHMQVCRFDITLKPVLDERGRVETVIFEGRDMSEQKLLETMHADLRFSRSVAAATPDLIFVFDLQSKRNIYVNKEIVGILGYSASQVAAMGQKVLSTLMHPDDYAQLPARLARVMALSDGEVDEHEYRLRAADGSWRWLWGRDVVFERGDDGRPTKTLGVVEDVSRRRQAEESLRLLAEVSSLLATSLDYEATVERIGALLVPTLADLCTIHTIDDEGHIHQRSVAHPDPEIVELVWALERRHPMDPTAATGMPQVIRSKQPEIMPSVEPQRLREFAWDAEHLAMLERLGLASSLCLPLVARGRTIGAVTFMITDSGRRYRAADLPLAEDIAGRAALALDNARLYREAQEAVAARDQFLSIASHELKTPLTALLGYAQLLRRRADREQSFVPRDRRVLDVIAQQAARLDIMIGSLLDLSRIQRGQLDVELRQLSLTTLVAGVAEEVEPMLESHSLAVELPPDPLLVQGDALRLAQVLHNLLSNAVKYSPAGGTIRLLAVRGADGLVAVAVADEGIGIPAEALPNLFGRFYRAHNGHHEQISGLGLGLFVVREIVALHGGEVRVESLEGQGSTFTVLLPLAEPQLGTRQSDDAEVCSGTIGAE